MPAYQLYAYTSQGRVYVGITRSPRRRHAAHRKRGPVSRLDNPAFEAVRTGLTVKRAQEAEKRLIRRYRAKGWEVLNRSDGGELGGRNQRNFTLDEVIQRAKAFRSRTDFCHGDPNLYGYALARGLLDEVAHRLGWPDHLYYRWTSLEACALEARRHPTLKTWRLESRPSYSAAMKNGWAAQIKALLFPKARKRRFHQEAFSQEFNCRVAPTKLGLRLSFAAPVDRYRFEEVLSRRFARSGYQRPGNRLLLPLGLAHAALPLLGVVIPQLPAPGKRTPTFA